jgi:hypothetical protein
VQCVVCMRTHFWTYIVCAAHPVPPNCCCR